jgi:hypothetical protein
MFLCCWPAERAARTGKDWQGLGLQSSTHRRGTDRRASEVRKHTKWRACMRPIGEGKAQPVIQLRRVDGSEARRVESYLVLPGPTDLSHQSKKG